MKRVLEVRSRRVRSAPGSSGDFGLADMIDREPDQAVAAETAEQYRQLLGKLADESLRAVAVWKLEGHTNEEIATRLGCTIRTVCRRLALIRDIWETDPQPAQDVGG